MKFKVLSSKENKLRLEFSPLENKISVSKLLERSDVEFSSIRMVRRSKVKKKLRGKIRSLNLNRRGKKIFEVTLIGDIKNSINES